MPMWIFARYDDFNTLLTPPFIVARGANEQMARQAAEAVSAGIKLSKGDAIKENVEAAWNAVLGDLTTHLVGLA